MLKILSVFETRRSAAMSCWNRACVVSSVCVDVFDLLIKKTAMMRYVTDAPSSVATSALPMAKMSVEESCALPNKCWRVI